MLINDVLTVFRQGKSLASASAWANTAAAGAALAGVLSGALHIARALGYALPGVTDDQVAAVAGGIAAAVGIASGLLGVAANPSAGLPSRPATDPAAGAGPSVDAQPPADRF